jgi:hypothetical protein
VRWRVTSARSLRGTAERGIVAEAEMGISGRAWDGSFVDRVNWELR